MLLDEYQTLARKTAVSFGLDHMVFGLVEEAGEVAGIMKRAHRGDAKYLDENKRVLSPFVDENLSKEGREEILAELGDVLWYLAMTAHVLGTNLSTVALRNIDKLKDRQARNVITGSGDKR